MIDEWRGAAGDGSDIVCDAVGNVCPWIVANGTNVVDWNISAAAAVLMVCTMRANCCDLNLGHHEYVPFFRDKLPLASLSKAYFVERNKILAILLRTSKYYLAHLAVPRCVSHQGYGVFKSNEFTTHRSHLEHLPVLADRLILPRQTRGTILVITLWMANHCGVARTPTARLSHRHLSNAKKAAGTWKRRTKPYRNY